MDSLTKIDMDENFPGFYKTALHQLYDRYSEIMEQPIVFEDYIDQKGTYPIIHALPKLDLHCHLGGCADLNNILSIANTFDKNPDYFIWLQEKIGDNAADLFTQKPLSVVDSLLLPGEERSADFVANIIQYLEETQQTALLDLHYGGSLANGEISSNFVNLGLENYLQLGDWSGAKLLQTEPALQKAIECILQKAITHHVFYLELRFNPLLYAREHLSPRQVYDIIRSAIQTFSHNEITVNLTFSLSKPKKDDSFTQEELNKARFIADLASLVHLTLQILDEQEQQSEIPIYTSALTGFDFAGLETEFDQNGKYGNVTIKLISRWLIDPILYYRINITAHVGETSLSYEGILDKNAWKRAIHEDLFNFKADRIGHALNMSDDTLELVKHHQILIELCPSSNCNTNSFIRTPWNTSNELLYEYPLERYYESGVPISINTDDPGISRTNWTREIYVASALCQNPLKIIDFLIISGNALKYCFVHDSNIRVQLEECFLNRVQDTLTNAQL